MAAGPAPATYPRRSSTASLGGIPGCPSLLFQWRSEGNEEPRSTVLAAPADPNRKSNNTPQSNCYINIEGRPEKKSPHYFWQELLAALAA